MQKKLAILGFRLCQPVVLLFLFLLLFLKYSPRVPLQRPLHVCVGSPSAWVAVASNTCGL